MKVSLKLLSVDHLDKLFLIKNNAAVLKNIPGDYPLDRNDFDKTNYGIINKGPQIDQAAFTIFVNEQIAGMTGHFCREEGADKEVGYFIGESWWGKGIATQALILELDEMRKIGISGKVIAGHAAENIASGFVLQKAGFSRNGENAFTLADGTVLMDPQWMILL